MEDVNEELKFCENSKKSGGGCRAGVGQGECDRRIEVFVKIKKNEGYRVGGRVGGQGGGCGGSGWIGGGHGGCERKMEVFVEMQEKKSRGEEGQVWPGMGIEGWGLVDREGVVSNVGGRG